MEIKVKDELIALERQISDAKDRYKTLSVAEIAELHKALDKKDVVIAAYEAEIVVLKKQKTSIWKKAEIFLVGAAAGAILVLVKK